MTAVNAAAHVEAGIGRLVIDNPPLNILTREVLRRVREALHRLAGEPSLRALLVTATGKHFSVGADVAEHLPPHHAALIPEFLGTVGAIAGFPLPVIAAVRGRCLGGGFELVQGADLVVAGEGAVFGQPEIRLGVIAPAACALLPSRCHAGAAAHLVFTGESITAAEAQRAGIVWRVVADQDAEREALRVAESIARHSGAALRLAKQALRQSAHPETTGALDHAGRIYLEGVMATADAVEGLQAFVDKRAPAWSHS